MRTVISVIGAVAVSVIVLAFYTHNFITGYNIGTPIPFITVAYCALILWLCFGFKGKKIADLMRWIAFVLVILVSAAFIWFIFQVLNLGDAVYKRGV